MPDTRSFATILLAVSLFCLAFALVFLALRLSSISEQIPGLLAGVERTSTKLEPLVKELPSVVAEVGEIRKQIPPILTQVEETRKQVPAILETVNGLSVTVDKAVIELAEVRPLVPIILKEVETTREAIPPMLSKADRLIDNARDVAREASKGAVTGVFTGILAAPFKLVGSVGKFFTGLSKDELEGMEERDLELFYQAGKEVLSLPDTGEKIAWRNPDTGYFGEITLVEIDRSKASECRVLGILIKKGKKIQVSKKATYCQNEDNVWSPES